MLVEKKLRDVTKEEFDNWCIRNCKDINCKNCLFNNVYCGIADKCNWVNHKDLYNYNFLDRTIKVEVGDKLDKVEKEYLSYVIKPFRLRIEYIRKFKQGTALCISIKMIDGDFMYFPNFVNQNMYAGLVLDKKYTLEELGL